jgi:biotin synthase-like enzyme
MWCLKKWDSKRNIERIKFIKEKAFLKRKEIMLQSDCHYCETGNYFFKQKIWSSKFASLSEIYLELVLMKKKR